MSSRYEIMPFGSVETELAAVSRPLVVTVTCSPRHGVDHSVEMAGRLAALGHEVIVHLGARAIRDADHLDSVLERLAGNGVHDLFLIGGDGQHPVGPYQSAVELLPVIDAHHRRPLRIGIAAYPEGHPLIESDTLASALLVKAQMADYMVTQMCFDPGEVLRWIDDTRNAGIQLPVFVGLPGAVDRRRLVELSIRVGVGNSIAFVRKQRGMRQLLGRPHHATDQLHQVFAPLIDDARRGIAGLHYFTFNRLSATLAWEAQRNGPGVADSQAGLSSRAEPVAARPDPRRLRPG